MNSGDEPLFKHIRRYSQSRVRHKDKFQEEAMYFETMIARAEHQLMQSEVAQLQTRDGVVMESERAQRGAGLVARIKALFTHTRVSEQAKRVNSTAVVSTR